MSDTRILYKPYIIGSTNTSFVVPAGGATGTAPTLHATATAGGAYFGGNNPNYGATNIAISTGDIILLLIHSENATGAGAAPVVTVITGTGDFSGLTWSNLAGATALTSVSGNPSNRVSLWWALASGTSGTNGFSNITFATAPDASSFVVSSISGCGNTTAPWDTNASLPHTSNDAATSIPSDAGISTTAPGTMVVSVTGACKSSAPQYTDQTQGAGFTLINVAHGAPATNFDGLGMEYAPFTTAQTGLSPAFAVSWANWIMMTHALVGT